MPSVHFYYTFTVPQGTYDTESGVDYKRAYEDHKDHCESTLMEMLDHNRVIAGDFPDGSMGFYPQPYGSSLDRGTGEAWEDWGYKYLSQTPEDVGLA